MILMTRRATRPYDLVLRMVKAQSQLGLDVLDMLMMSALVDAYEPWPISSLSIYLGVPRTNVHRRLNKWIATGGTLRVSGGVIFTNQARLDAQLILDETLEIAEGTRGGYSETLLNRLLRYQQTAE